MTTCTHDRACMTEQFQWSSLVVVISVAILVVFGIYLVIKQIIEEDIEDATKKDIEELTEHLYLRRKQTQLISPSALQWLERKINRQ